MPTATPSTQEAQIIARDDVAVGTMAFYFERPAGFAFRAGQAMDVTLIDPPEADEEGSTRTFSIASAPFEPELMIATRLRDSAFKRALAHAPQNLRVRIEGPSGSLTLHHDAKKPAVFLAGGIGITPFHSIVMQARHERLPHELYLFYSNRRPEDAPFIDALRETAAAYPRLHFIPTMTEMETSQRPWDGERGVIDAEMLKRHVPALGGPIYYLAGPPRMVAAMQQMLTAAGVDEDDVRTEEFAGY
jgi:ferredoxin-NADP reductase